MQGEILINEDESLHQRIKKAIKVRGNSLARGGGRNTGNTKSGAGLREAKTGTLRPKDFDTKLQTANPKVIKYQDFLQKKSLKPDSGLDRKEST